MIDVRYFKFPDQGTFPRIAPFALFMSFIGIEEVGRFLAVKEIITLSDTALLYLYPLKAVSVGLLLYLFRKSYVELDWRDLKQPATTIASLLIGVIVCVLWINMTWTWASIGTSQGFNPDLVSETFTRSFLIFSRLIGAAVIVPIMEEIFWRSWLLRYIISQDFQAVKLGTFSLSSFLIGTVMFGLEHNLWLAGIMAGALYSILLYSTKSLAQCIIAHAVTNLILGMYVLNTGRWEFW